MSAKLVRLMRKQGVHIRFFRNPLRWRIWEADSRTHRKVLVCDDTIGFTGGVGIAREWCGDARSPEEWRDTHFRVRGPAIDGFRAAFLENWIESGGTPYSVESAEHAPDRADGISMQTVRSNANLHWSNVGTALLYFIRGARKRLWVNTPYFVPRSFLARELARAARRGVDVRIIVPGTYSDSRLSQRAGEGFYGHVLRSGGRMWRYDPTFPHNKALIADGCAVFAGSPNFNQRSIRKDDEFCIIMINKELTAEMEEHFKADLERSTPITMEEWSNRPLPRKLASLALRWVDNEL